MPAAPDPVIVNVEGREELIELLDLQPVKGDPLENCPTQTELVRHFFAPSGCWATIVYPPDLTEAFRILE